MVMLAQAVGITRHMQPQLRRTTIGSKSQGLMCCNGQSSNQAPTQRDTCQTTEDIVITQSCSPGAINRGYGSHVQHAPPDGLATALTRSSLSEPQPFCKCWRKCVSFFGLVVAVCNGRLHLSLVLFIYELTSGSVGARGTELTSGSAGARATELRNRGA